MAKSRSAVTIDGITRAILVLRGHKVLLDRELARIYGVETRVPNQAAKRNAERFPEDFRFQLTATEAATLNRSQPVTGSQKHRDPRFHPFAFTEHGAIIAATLLNSPRAIEMGIYVVRAFVQLRGLQASDTELAKRLDELETCIEKKLARHDDATAFMLSAIRALMHPPAPKRRGIGFTADIDSRK